MKTFDVVGYAINGSVFCACCGAYEGGDPIFAGEEFDESIFCEDCGEPVVEVDDGLHEVAVLKVSYTYGTMKVKAESFREAEQKVRELIRLGNLPPDSPEIKWEAVDEERMELDPTL